MSNSRNLPSETTMRSTRSGATLLKPMAINKACGKKAKSRIDVRDNDLGSSEESLTIPSHTRLNVCPAFIPHALKQLLGFANLLEDRQVNTMVANVAFKRSIREQRRSRSTELIMKGLSAAKICRPLTSGKISAATCSNAESWTSTKCSVARPISKCTSVEGLVEADEEVSKPLQLRSRRS
jgi:hypothetical protein